MAIAEAAAGALEAKTSEKLEKRQKIERMIEEKLSKRQQKLQEKKEKLVRVHRCLVIFTRFIYKRRMRKRKRGKG